MKRIGQLTLITAFLLLFVPKLAFAQAMKDIGLKPTQAAAGWYYSTHPFAIDTFASNINNFSNSFSNAIAQTPSKGGGFSGGGSSGGGFGGGGRRKLVILKNYYFPG